MVPRQKKYGVILSRYGIGSSPYENGSFAVLLMQDNIRISCGPRKQAGAN